MAAGLAGRQPHNSTPGDSMWHLYYADGPRDASACTPALCAAATPPSATPRRAWFRTHMIPHVRNPPHFEMPVQPAMQRPVLHGSGLRLSTLITIHCVWLLRDRYNNPSRAAGRIQLSMDPARSLQTVRLPPQHTPAKALAASHCIKSSQQPAAYHSTSQGFLG